MASNTVKKSQAHPGLAEGNDGPYRDAGHGGGGQDASCPVGPPRVGVLRPIILGGRLESQLHPTFVILNSDISVICRITMKSRNVGDMNFQHIFQYNPGRLPNIAYTSSEKFLRNSKCHGLFKVVT